MASSIVKIAAVFGTAAQAATVDTSYAAWILNCGASTEKNKAGGTNSCMEQHCGTAAQRKAFAEAAGYTEADLEFDSAKCTENGAADPDCAAKSTEAGCADGYKLASSGRTAWADNAGSIGLTTCCVKDAGAELTKADGTKEGKYSQSFAKEFLLDLHGGCSDEKCNDPEKDCFAGSSDSDTCKCKNGMKASPTGVGYEGIEWGDLGKINVVQYTCCEAAEGLTTYEKEACVTDRTHFPYNAPPNNTAFSKNGGIATASALVLTAVTALFA